MVQAMKDKNEVSRDILRVLRGEIQRNEQTSKGKIELADADIVKIVKKLIESVKESGEDNGEIAILESYLPQQMSELNITDTVIEYAAMHKLDSPKEMGKVMASVKKELAGRADMSKVSSIVKSSLV